LKLNNRGWGLQAMMVLVLVLMIALILVAIMIEKNFGNIVGNDSHTIKLEERAVTAAKKYQKKYPVDNNEQQRVSIEKLIDEKLLDKLYYEGTSCTGYVNYTENDYHAYIKCGSKYTTKGYK